MKRVLLCVLLAASCEAGGVDANSPAQLWTLFSVQAALQEGKAIAPAASDPFAAGFPAGDFLAGPRGLKGIYAFSEGLPATYVTPEMWTNYPVVWLQPMYVLVTEWDVATRKAKPLPDAKSIFSVGAGSKFYSPFWRIFYVIVPSGTPADKYRSVRQIFDDKLPLRPGPGRLCVLRPESIGGFTPSSTAAGFGVGWIDGKAAPVIDFGGNRFTWNGDLEIQEQPLFFFFRRTKDGTLEKADVPAVVGTGPLFSRTPAMAPANRPAFGSLSRYHAVVLPGTAAAVDPAKHAILAGAVVLDRACLDRADFESACTFLHSQKSIEDNLPQTSIIRTGILATSPLMQFAGIAVPPP